jgi:hypothetical protein
MTPASNDEACPVAFEQLRSVDDIWPDVQAGLENMPSNCIATDYLRLCADSPLAPVRCGDEPLVFWCSFAYDTSIIQAEAERLAKALNPRTRFAKWPWNFTIAGVLKATPHLTNMERRLHLGLDAEVQRPLRDLPGEGPDSSTDPTSKRLCTRTTSEHDEVTSRFLLPELQQLPREDIEEFLGRTIKMKTPASSVEYKLSMRNFVLEKKLHGYEKRTLAFEREHTAMKKEMETKWSEKLECQKKKAEERLAEARKEIGVLQLQSKEANQAHAYMRSDLEARQRTLEDRLAKITAENA